MHTLTPDAPVDMPAFVPQPLRGDASFGRLLDHQRQLLDEHRRTRTLEDGDAQLLPLMLSLARISARAQVIGADALLMTEGA
jgi:hypothetical protein